MKVCIYNKIHMIDTFVTYIQVAGVARREHKSHTFLGRGEGGEINISLQMYSYTKFRNLLGIFSI